MSDYRGQGYDNGGNMSGSYNRAQSQLLALNPLAKFCPCARHSLNLYGEHAAECCPEYREVQQFFGVAQQLHNLFSCSRHRWVKLR